MNVDFASRNFFLDNLDNYEYINGQFKKLIEFALKNGQAIGIGHAKNITLEILKDEIALMQARGIELVFVSYLVE